MFPGKGGWRKVIPWRREKKRKFDRGDNGDSDDNITDTFHGAESPLVLIRARNLQHLFGSGTNPVLNKTENFGLGSYENQKRFGLYNFLKVPVPIPVYLKSNL